MKTLKALYLVAVLLAIVLPFVSCKTMEVFGTKIAIVSNRAPDGAFILPSSPVSGEQATSSATLYRFPGGDLGVTLWSGDAAGTAPALRNR